MVFSSYIFTFFFLPIVLCCYYLLSNFRSGVYQRLFIISASLFFYGYFNKSYLFIILSSIIINYFIALILEKSNKIRFRNILFIVGIIFNLGLLGYYKYYDFFITNINFIFKSDYILKHLLLPLGISFFTFQQFSFLLSVFKREENVESLLDYALFVTFFPQLIAGPIVTYKEMMSQFKDEQIRFFCPQNFYEGIFIFVLGLFKKIVFADSLAVFVHNGFSMTNELGLSAAWVTSLAYTFQIYFDFSGYSDMAIGLGKMFNINLPVNFNSPYKSLSISDFWRRWHITLGRALRQFIYIPLGGNKKHVHLNLLVTFLLSGLWHGAGWTFIVWGGVHGFFTVIERIFKKPLQVIPKKIRIFITFLIVNFSWVLFRADNIHEAFNIYKAMFNFHNINFHQLSALVNDGIIGFPTSINLLYLFCYLIISILIIFFTPNVLELNEKFKKKKISAIVLSLIYVFAIIHLSRVSTFIYFNF